MNTISLETKTHRKQGKDKTIYTGQWHVYGKLEHKITVTNQMAFGMMTVIGGKHNLDKQEKDKTCIQWAVACGRKLQTSQMAFGMVSYRKKA